MKGDTRSLDYSSYEPITTLGKLGDYWCVPFVGSLTGNGKLGFFGGPYLGTQQVTFSLFILGSPY